MIRTAFDLTFHSEIVGAGNALGGASVIVPGDTPVHIAQVSDTDERRVLCHVSPPDFWAHAWAWVDKHWMLQEMTA